MIASPIIIDQFYCRAVKNTEEATRNRRQYSGNKTHPPGLLQDADYQNSELAPPTPQLKCESGESVVSAAKQSSFGISSVVVRMCVSEERNKLVFGVRER